MRVANGVIEGEDPDRDRFEIYFHSLVGGPDANPDEALDVVLELIAAAPDDYSLAYISAGPVQAVIVDLGPQIERVEQAAVDNELLRKALAAVSLTSADPDVAARVKGVRAETW